MEEFEKNTEEKYKDGNPYTFAREELLKDEDIVKAANKRDAIFTGEQIANLDLPKLNGVGINLEAKIEFLKNHPEITIDELPEDFFTPEEKEKMDSEGFAIVSPSGIDYEEFSPKTR